MNFTLLICSVLLNSLIPDWLCHVFHEIVSQEIQLHLRMKRLSASKEAQSVSRSGVNGIADGCSSCNASGLHAYDRIVCRYIQ